MSTNDTTKYQLLQLDDKLLMDATSEKYLHVRKRRKVPFYYFMVIQGGVTLLHERVPSVSAHSLFFFVVEPMLPTANNIVPVHFGNLAEHFGVSVNAIYKQFKLLLQGDILRKIRKGVYLVNPHIIWSGDGEKRYHAVREWDHPKETP